MSPQAPVSEGIFAIFDKESQFISLLLDCIPDFKYVI